MLATLSGGRSSVGKVVKWQRQCWQGYQVAEAVLVTLSCGRGSVGNVIRWQKQCWQRHQVAEAVLVTQVAESVLATSGGKVRQSCEEDESWKKRRRSANEKGNRLR